MSVEVTSGTTYQVSAGWYDYEDTIDYGGEEDVLSAGETDYATDSGTLVVSAGGFAYGTYVAEDAIEQVFGSATGDTVRGELDIYGGSESDALVQIGVINVAGGGMLSDSTVLVGGSVNVGAGATGGAADGLRVYGFLEVKTDGVVSGTQILSAGYVEVDGRDSGTVVSSGGTEWNPGDGVTIGATILSGGQAEFDPGFVASGVSVSSGGVAYLGAIVRSGAAMTVGVAQSQTTVSGVTAQSGGTLDLVLATVLDGGVVSLSPSGAIYGLTVSAGGVVSGPGLINLNHGYDAGLVTGAEITNFNDNDGVFEVAAGGMLASARVDSSVVVNVDAGGTASGVVASSGAVMDVDGTGEGLTVLSGALVNTDSGGVLMGSDSVYGLVSGLGVGAGGRLTVESGGYAEEMTLSKGAVETVLSGGGDTQATVLSGAKLIVSSGAYANETMVSHGGAVSGPGLLDGVITDNGLVSGAALDDGAILYVQSGGAASGVVATGEASQVYLFSGGRAVGVTVAGQNASAFVDAGGVISGLTLSSGTDATVSGLVSGATVMGGLTVAGGVASAVTLDEGLEYIEDGGVAAGATLNSGSELMAFASGSATGVVTVSSGSEVYSEYGPLTFQSGSTELLYPGGSNVPFFNDTNPNNPTVDFDVVIGSGATMELADLVISAGSAFVAGPVNATEVYYAATVSAGAYLATLSATVLNGAEEVVNSGGQAIDTTVSSGGLLIVSSGGSAVYSGGGATVIDGTLSGGGLVLQRGPGVLVQSGLASGFTGSAVISGGTIELATASRLGTAQIAFAAPAAGSATLELLRAAAPKTGKTFAEALKNFDAANEALDLRNQAYVTGATATVSGTTLTVIDGSSYTAAFKLAGQHASTYQVTNDGHGDTLITPVASQAQNAVHAIASFDAANAPAGALASSTMSAFAPLIATPAA